MFPQQGRICNDIQPSYSKCSLWTSVIWEFARNATYLVSLQTYWIDPGGNSVSYLLILLRIPSIVLNNDKVCYDLQPQLQIPKRCVKNILMTNTITKHSNPEKGHNFLQNTDSILKPLCFNEEANSKQQKLSLYLFLGFLLPLDDGYKFAVEIIQSLLLLRNH